MSAYSKLIEPSASDALPNRHAFAIAYPPSALPRKKTTKAGPLKKYFLSARPSVCVVIAAFFVCMASRSFPVIAGAISLGLG